ncbi:MAG: site-specific integrase [Cyclobacteriaceae bacterium]
MNVTTEIILDTRRVKKDGSYPVKLRLTYKGRQKYYSLGISFDRLTWDQITSLKPPKKLKEKKLYMDSFEHKANSILRELESFTFKNFESNWNSNTEMEISLLYSLKCYERDLRVQGNIGTADTYKCSHKSFEKFLNENGNSDIDLNELSIAWLQEYEAWMKSLGRGNSTIGMYLRNVRTVYNQAIDNGKVNRESYPFGKRRYQIPSSRNFKRALKKEHIKLILEYNPDSEQEARARDLWVFSYLMNGANIADIARLRNESIKGDQIVYIRKKTQSSTHNISKQITCLLTPPVKAIIQKWGTTSTVPNDLIFDIIKPNATPEERKKQTKQGIKTINKWMSRIGEKLGIDIKLTTYVARHSFATVSKNSGVPLEYISEKLAHTSLKTTALYLGDFNDEQQKDYHNRLLEF